MKPLPFLIVLILLTSPLASISQDCEKVKIADFPKKDLPQPFDTTSAKKSPPTEESYKYYYGIGVPIDYTKARHLAFVEMVLHREDEAPFQGSSILIMLYANGFGVKQDLDLCIRLACANVGFADAEIEGRIEHLKQMRSGTSTKTFDLCDDITSGYMSGYCESIHSELTAVKRDDAVDSVLKRWPEKARTAYQDLRKTASAFFTERVNAEVEMSGTARAALAIGESTFLEDGFAEDVMSADKCAFKTASSGDFMEADKKLNALYKQVMNVERSGGTTITKEGIRSAQRAWIKYRDAWVSFGAVRCPQISETSWKTMITNERIGQLQQLLDE